MKLPSSIPCGDRPCKNKKEGIQKGYFIQQSIYTFVVENNFSFRSLFSIWTFYLKKGMEKYFSNKTILDKE